MLFHIWSMLVVLVLLTNTVQNDNKWVSTPPILPRSDLCMASFHYNDWIYIFGGFYYKRSLVQYNIHNGSIIDHGENALPLDVIGFSQYWTQISNIFYWIDQGGANIIIYNVTSNTFEQNITIPLNVYKNGCLATDGEVLAVIGGGYYSDASSYALQIYNLSTGLWLNNTPSMQQSRSGGFTCMIVDNTIYAIGGFIGNGYDNEATKTIEKISLNDIENQNWQFIQDLTFTTANLRSVTRGNFIYAVAGYYYNSSDTQYAVGYVERIQIINCLTGTVTNGSYLNFTVRSISVVIVNDVIYAFGGKTEPEQPDLYRRMQYFSVLTNEPTYNPTTEPTNIPSLEPTIYPTSVPTLEPTTYMPSLYPSEMIVSTSLQLSSEIDVTYSKDSEIDDPNDNIWIYILIIIGCVIFLLGVIGCIVLYKYKLKKTDNATKSSIKQHVSKNDHQQVLELNATTEQTNVTQTVDTLETTEMINT